MVVKNDICTIVKHDKQIIALLGYRRNPVHVIYESSLLHDTHAGVAETDICATPG